MIYIFGSMHIDNKEALELKPFLSKINATRGIVAIELENNEDTVRALKNFRSLTGRKVKKILEYHFGKRRIASTSNLLRLVQKYKGIEEMVAIEPKPSKRMALLDKRLKDSYEAAFNYIKNSKSTDKKAFANTALGKYFVYVRTAAIQCMFREKAMLRVVEGLERQNPQRGILVYCGYFHSAQLKRMLSNRGIKFVSRNSTVTNLLEDRSLKIANMTLSKPFDKLGASERMELCKELVFENSVWERPKDMSIKRYYGIGKKVQREIRSFEDYEKAVARS